MKNMQSRLVRYIDTIAAIIFTSILVIAVIQFDIFATIDGDIHLIWGYFWNQQLLNGQLYPKWFEEAFGGLGSTSFVFYPPLFRIFSFPFALFHLLPSQQIKGSIIIALFINAIGVVKLSRILFLKNHLHNLIAISLGIFNPFLMNEIFKRGGFPSICSLVLIPWIIISLAIYLENQKTINLIFLVIVLSAFFASHIPSSLIFASTYISSIVILIILGKIDYLFALSRLIFPFVFALLLDAFLILPILFDTDLVHQAFTPKSNTIRNSLFFQDILKFKLSIIPRSIENNIAKIFLFDLIIFILTSLSLKTKCWLYFKIRKWYHQGD